MPERREVESWVAVLAMTGLAAIALATVMGLLRGAGTAVDALRGVTYANTALAGSAVLYLVYAWLRADYVGRAASALAAGGALGILVALGIGAARSDRAALGLHEAMALLSAAAVLAYLVMERTYRNRSAGLVVMAAVMAAVSCEMWLIARGFAAGGFPQGGFGRYWEAGHRFASCLGYGPIAVGALLGAMAPARPTTRLAARGAMHALLAVGAPLLVLGAGMGAVWGIVDRGALPHAAARIAISWLVAGLVLAAWLAARSADDPRLPRCSFAAFAIASAGLLASSSLGGPAG